MLYAEVRSPSFQIPHRALQHLHVLWWWLGKLPSQNISQKVSS